MRGKRMVLGAVIGVDRVEGLVGIHWCFWVGWSSKSPFQRHFRCRFLSRLSFITLILLCVLNHSLPVVDPSTCLHLLIQPHPSCTIIDPIPTTFSEEFHDWGDCRFALCAPAQLFVSLVHLVIYILSFGIILVFWRSQGVRGVDGVVEGRWRVRGHLVLVWIGVGSAGVGTRGWWVRVLHWLLGFMRRVY